MTRRAEVNELVPSGQPRHLVANVSEAQAAQRFARKFWRQPAAARLEPVAWPNFLTEFELTPAAKYHANDSNGAHTRRVYVYVDGCEPSCVNMSQTPWPTTANGPPQRVAPTIAADEAQAAARRTMANGVLAAARWRTAAQYAAIAPAAALFWPLWAYYHRRKSGILDVLLLDAVRNAWCGPKVKGAFLASLVKRQ